MINDFPKAESDLLKYLFKNRTDNTFSGLKNASRLPQGAIPWAELMPAVWSLLSKKLVYINFEQPSTSYWTIQLTAKGYAAASEEDPTPDNTHAYFNFVLKKAPDISISARYYLSESIKSFEADSYAASTVMLGVAAEACFLDVARTYCKWESTSSGEKLERILNDPHSSYIYKFEEFQKRLQAAKSAFPPDLKHGLDTNVGAILDLLRVARNEVGHPNGIVVDKDTAFTNLSLFPRLIARMYALKSFFMEKLDVVPD